MKQDRLPEAVVKLIRNAVDVHRNKSELINKFPNKLLRKDVLDMLDIYCTIIYYPSDDTKNNGFNIKGIPDKNGNEKHFVYINTNQTIDKQIFTAAHELGHMWKIDEYVNKELEAINFSCGSEGIINRFAAELLMPKEQFLSVLKEECDKYTSNDGEISVVNFFRVIVFLMNFFCVPFKSVAYRLYELDQIDENITEMLLGEGELDKTIIDAVVYKMLRENGHMHLLNPTNVKFIDGLAEMLDKADAQKTLPAEKIENLRKLFDLDKKEIEGNGLENKIQAPSTEGE